MDMFACQEIRREIRCACHTDRVGTILDHHQAVMPGDLGDGWHVCRLAAEVNWHAGCPAAYE